MFLAASILVPLFIFGYNYLQGQSNEYYNFHQGYQNTVECGFAALVSNNLLDAERYFRNGVEIQPRGKSAFLGYSHTVILLCKEQGLHCKEAGIRLDLIKRSKLDDTEKQKYIDLFGNELFNCEDNL